VAGGMQTRQRFDPPPTEKGEATKRRILEVAAKAFAESGYDGTSLNDVIRDAGATKGGFYFHFPSKEALALEVLQDKRERWAGRVLAASMRHERAFEQLRAIPDALCDLYEQDPSAAAIGRLCQDLSENPVLRPQITPQFTTWVDLTASIIRKAQAQGDVRPEVDPIDAAWVAVGSFIGIEMVSAMMTGLADLRQRNRPYLELFSRAIATEAGSDHFE
jgi:AcrR family transcriptional regulator